MNEYEAYEVIKRQLCKEVVEIAENIQKNNTMSVAELEKVDKIYHAKKSMLTAKAMEEAEEYEGQGGYSGTRMTYSGANNSSNASGRRGRGADGRFVSRESYDEGYDRGYSEGMSRARSENYSGHYPMPVYPGRW